MNYIGVIPLVIGDFAAVFEAGFMFVF